MPTPVTHADVVAVYRGVLGREPENEEVVDAFVAQGVSLEEMIAQAIRSDEFTNGLGADVGRYKGPPLPQLLPGTYPPEPKAARVAILVRSHIMDQKFDHMWSALHGQNGRERLYDVFPLLDAQPLAAQRAQLQARYPSAIWVGPEELRSAGLTQHSVSHPDLWLMGDAAMYVALLRQPDYDYYVMIDYDVHFTRDPIDYLNRLCRRLLSGEDVVDGVGLDHNTEPTRSTTTRDWPFWAPAAKAFRLVYHFYLPVVAVSRRGLLYCFAGRQLEAARRTPSDDLVNCESFLPSTLRSGGFECADLNTVLPGSYQIASMGLQHVVRGELSGLPLSRAETESFGDVEMIHGVYSDEYFLARNLKIMWDFPDELEMFGREVRAQYADLLPAELIADYIERAQRRRAEFVRGA